MACFASQTPGFEVLPHLVRMISKGSPITLQELADEGSLPVADLESMLRSQPGTDWDEAGRLVGFGLTLRPTTHRFTVAGRVLYTFCATDALLFTHILGEPAVAESVCPVTSQPIRIDLTPGAVVSIDPPDAVVSQILNPALLGDLRHNICDQGHFFASADAADGWMREHPEGQVLTVEEAFDRCRRDVEELGWLPRSAQERAS
ncbi:MAG: organomercurial lyase MerB [Candidatus Dormibacteraceae bacterium]